MAPFLVPEVFLPVHFSMWAQIPNYLRIILQKLLELSFLRGIQLILHNWPSLCVHRSPIPCGCIVFQFVYNRHSQLARATSKACSCVGSDFASSCEHINFICDRTNQPKYQVWALPLRHQFVGWNRQQDKNLVPGLERPVLCVLAVPGFLLPLGHIQVFLYMLCHALQLIP